MFCFKCIFLRKIFRKIAGNFPENVPPLHHYYIVVLFSSYSRIPPLLR